MEMTNMEKGAFLKLFNRGGYVLDFTTPDFNAFTLDSVGVALCQKYNLSKGKSLIAYIDEASDDNVFKLFADLLHYYETDYHSFENETSESDLLGIDDGEYRTQYLKCKEIIVKYRMADSNSEIAKAVDKAFSTEYMSQQIKLMLEKQESFPAEAIGKAKELIESCCRTILKDHDIAINENWTFQQLVSKTFDILDVLPAKVDIKCPIAGSLKRIYGSLKGIVTPIAEIRNEYGTGHGRTADFEGLDARHAKLLVGMSATLVQFLWDTASVVKNRGI